MKRICVYCGSSPGRQELYVQSARSLGKVLVAQGLELVYGGARIGVMGAVADQVLSLGGVVTGIMPQALVDKEVAHQGLSKLHVVGSMHERKMLMAELSDGFIALPGGFGTLEEIFEVLTWNQLGFHQKPCGLLNIGGYYDHLATFLNHSVQEQFVKQQSREMLMVEDRPETLLKAFDAYRAPVVNQWIHHNQT